MFNKRIIVTAPFFLFTLAIGVGLFIGTTAVSARLKPAKELASPVRRVEDKKPDVTVTATPETASSVVTETEEPAKPTPQEIYWEGVYNFDSEALSKEFSGLSHLELVTHDYNKTDENGEGLPIPPKGFLKAGKTFKFQRIGIAGKQIAFQTETVGGVSYRFTGKYLALDYCETDGPTPDISGELNKIVDGKWAASMTAKLYAEGCGC